MFGRLKAKKEHSEQKKEKKKIARDLQKAAMFGWIDNVLELVAKHGDDPQIINWREKHKPGFMSGAEIFFGPTALITAARQGHAEVVRALLKAKSIDVNLVDQAEPVIEGLRPGVRSIRPSSPDFYNNTALLAAITAKHLDVANVLAARADVSVNAETGSGMTALIAAVKYVPSCLPALLKMEGVNVNAQDKAGCTALTHACLRRNEYGAIQDYIYQLLGVKGINVDVADENGWTPLMHVARRGDHELVGVLLREGADPALTNKVGANAADIAVLNGHDGVAGMLQPRQRARMRV